MKIKPYLMSNIFKKYENTFNFSNNTKKKQKNIKFSNYYYFFK